MGSKGKAPSAPAAEQLRAMIKEAVAVVLKEQGVELSKSKESEEGAPRGPPAASGSGEIFEHYLVINSFRVLWHTLRGAVSCRPEGAHLGEGGQLRGSEGAKVHSESEAVGQAQYPRGSGGAGRWELGWQPE